MSADLTRVLMGFLVGYLCGSLSFARLSGRIHHIDVTAGTEDGNPGGANVFSRVGHAAGVLVVILDIAKGALPVFLYNCRYGLDDPLAALVIAAPVIGHAWPIWNLRAGGKSISTSFGCLIGILPAWRPLAVLILLYLVSSLLIIVSPHALRTIFVYGLLALSACFDRLSPARLWGVILISLVVIIRHLSTAGHEKLSVRTPFSAREAGASRGKR